MKKVIKHVPLPLIKIHIVRSDDMGKFQFDEIFSLLKNFSGKKSDLITFTPHHIDPKFDIDDRENETPKHLSLTKRNDENFNPENKEEMSIIFDKCKKIREKKSKKIDENDLVILLTNQKDPNFMSYCDNGINNVFILTNGWDQIMGEFQTNLPIIYEIYAWIFRKFVFENKGNLIHYLKKETIGCIMDFCPNKEDFRMKIRTADIQPEVINLIRSKKYYFPHFKHILSVFENIRIGVLNRERSELFSDMVKIKFVKNFNDNYNIVIPEYGNVSLGLEAIERSIYETILSQGKVGGNTIVNSDLLVDNLDKHSANNRTNANKDKTIENLKNNLNSLYQKVSKINRKLRKVLPDQIVDEYLIHNDDKYFIKLSKDYYEFDEGY
jgi:hypothetical protein